MKKSKSLIAGGLVLSGCLALGFASPANASTWKNGFKSCGTSMQLTTAFTTGTTTHTLSPSGIAMAWNGSTWKYSHGSASAVGGGAWEVYTTGNMLSLETFAKCSTGV